MDSQDPFSGGAPVEAYSDSQMALWVSTPVPEPASWMLWLAGGGIAGAAARRRQRGRVGPST